MAERIVRIEIAVIVLALVAAGLCDLVLYLMGRPTISQFLRTHPNWFFAPAALLLVFLVALYLHLFVLSGWLY